MKQVKTFFILLLAILLIQGCCDNENVISDEKNEQLEYETINQKKI